MNYDINNIFAKIIKKELPADIVYEDDNILCFKDKYPKKKTHYLVIPKGNFVNFSDFVSNSSSENVVNFFKKVEKIASEILNISHYKILTNNGEKADQVIFHFHVHILSDEAVI